MCIISNFVCLIFCCLINYLNIVKRHWRPWDCRGIYFPAQLKCFFSIGQLPIILLLCIVPIIECPY